MISLLLFLYGCTNENSAMNEDLFQKNQMENLNAKSDKTVEVPFEFNFYTVKTPFTGVYDCPEGTGVNYQVGEGEGTHLGRFDIIITFCGSPDFSYGNGTGTFVAANGDELYIEIVEGQVVPIFDNPYYEAFFADNFTIAGGTGRFEGATGSGVTYSFVDLFTNGWYTPDNTDTEFIEAHQTDHVFSGTLIFKPGSRSN